MYDGDPDEEFEDDEYDDEDLVEYEVPDLGPDERDMDLIDGTWEEKYYSRQLRTRNWQAVQVGVALLIVAGLVLPALLVFLR